MSLNGWIKVHRKMLDHWVSQEPELFAFWMRLLLEANHSDTKRMFNGSLIEIKRGQTLFGLEAFEVKSGISKKKLRRYLDMLETEQMIGRQKTNKYSLISILNYDQYQIEGSQEAGQWQAEGKPRASQGQHRKNVNNVENEKEDTPYSPPKGDDVPYGEIFDLYHELLPDLPPAPNQTKKRKDNIKARWHEKVKVPAKGGFEDWDCNTLEFWQRFFGRVANSPHLMGENDRGWQANLEWITKKENFYKIIEGNYVRTK